MLGLCSNGKQTNQIPLHDVTGLETLLTCLSRPPSNFCFFTGCTPCLTGFSVCGFLYRTFGINERTHLTLNANEDTDGNKYPWFN